MVGSIKNSIVSLIVSWLVTIGSFNVVLRVCCECVAWQRPSVLLLCQDPADPASFKLIDFCNNLKKGGVYVLGSVGIGAMGTNQLWLNSARTKWLQLIDTLKIKAFTEASVGPTMRDAYQNLVLMSGLGGMRPNTVVVPFPEALTALKPFVGREPEDANESPATAEARDIAREISRWGQRAAAAVDEDGAKGGVLPVAGPTSAAEFCALLRDTLGMQRNLVLARGFESLNKHGIRDVSRTLRTHRSEAQRLRIDVWVPPLSSYGIRGMCRGVCVSSPG